MAIENKVATSGLLQVDLLEFKPQSVLELDLKDQLWQGLAIREKDFRAWIKSHDWEAYGDAPVALFCSEDAIIPPWVFMLTTSALSKVNASVKCLAPKDALLAFWIKAIEELDLANYKDARLVVKGCGDESVPHEVYAAFMHKIQSVVRSVMYGEPCSTVPLYKRPK